VSNSNYTLKESLPAAQLTVSQHWRRDATLDTRFYIDKWFRCKKEHKSL